MEIAAAGLFRHAVPIIGKQAMNLDIDVAVIERLGLAQEGAVPIDQRKELLGVLMLQQSQLRALRKGIGEHLGCSRRRVRHSRDR